MVRNFNRWLIAALIVTIISGIVLIAWTAQNEDSRIREDLLTKSRLAEKGFTINQIRALTGSEADLSSPDYIAVKEELIRVRSADPLIRFIYVMGQQPDGTVVFLVDSEPPESEDYSPPGQVYEEVSPILLNAFLSDMKETTEGPFTDRWGTWVSSITPIIDPGTGRVIGVFGMDVDARDWNMRIFMSCLSVATSILTILLILLVFSYINQRNEHERQILQESEKTLRESEHKLNDIINFLPDATFVIDLEGRVIKWNKSMEEMTGVRANDILGKGNYEYALPFYGNRRPILINLLQEPDSEMEKKYTGGIQKVGNMLMTETDIYRPGGSYSFLAARASPLCDVEGHVYGAIESIRDITFRKMAENELKISEERFRLLFQNVNDGIIVHEVFNGNKGLILEVNEHACQILGYSREELLHLSLTDLDVPEHHEKYPAISKQISSRKSAIFETEYFKKDGQRLPVEINIRLFELRGKPTILQIVRDITERKVLEQATEYYNLELRRNADTLRLTNDKLNLMNSITRHDILNQLTAIIGYLELTKDIFLDPRLQEYIGKEMVAAQNIQNQILFTKEYQDIGSQSPKWFDLRSVILSASQGLTLAPITLAVHIDHVEIYADPLLEKVFYTLMENGIRHGKTITHIIFSSRETETGLVVIYEDNGMGVPADHKEDIFQKKYFQHTGYGLFLSQTILNITGIAIKETGEPGKGARFEILVPKEAYRFF